MSAELIGIITVGVGLFSANLAMTGFVLVLFDQLERRSNQRIDRLEDRIGSEINQLRTEMGRRFDEQDVRIRGLEQGQAYMSGQFAELKDYFTHRSASGNSPETGD